MNAAEALLSLVTTLEELRELLPRRKEDWDGQPVVRLAIERLWITAGNLAERHRTEHGISTGVEPWAELVGYRNLLAHALPGDVSSDRVFADSSGDLERMLAELRQRQA